MTLCIKYYVRVKCNIVLSECPYCETIELWENLNQDMVQTLSKQRSMLHSLVVRLCMQQTNQHSQLLIMLCVFYNVMTHKCLSYYINCELVSIVCVEYNNILCTKIGLIIGSYNRRDVHLRLLIESQVDYGTLPRLVLFL